MVSTGSRVQIPNGAQVKVNDLYLILCLFKMNSAGKKIFRRTYGRAAVGAITALQAAEEYMSRIHHFSIFNNYLDPYFLDKAIHFSFFYGASEIADDVLQRKVKSKSLRLAITFALGTAGSIAKEFYDVSNGLEIDPLDLTSNYLGMIYYFWHSRRN